MKYFFEMAKQNNVDKWDLFYINSITRSLSFEDTRLEKIDNANSEGIGIRVIKDGKSGFSTAPSFDNRVECFKKAIEISNYGEETGLELPVQSINSPDNYLNPEIESLSLEEMSEQGRRIVDFLKSNGPRYMPHATVANDVHEVRVYNSSGLSSSYRKSQYVSFFGCSLIEEGNFIKRHKAIIKNDRDIYDQNMLERLILEMEALEKKAEVSKGLYDILFTPNAVISIMLAFWRGISGSSVEKGLSPLTGRLTEQIFDKAFTIISDPADMSLPDCMPFDDEGVKTRKVPIVTGGYLENYLLDLRSAHKLNMEPNGHGLRIKGLMGGKTHAAAPSPTPVNLQILPGTAEKEEMVKDIKNGIIIDDIMGILMSNLISGEFSGNISTGVRVVNGRRTGRVKDCMVSGNIYELFKDNLIGISSNAMPCITLGFSGIMPYIYVRDVFIS